MQKIMLRFGLMCTILMLFFICPKASAQNTQEVEVLTKLYIEPGIVTIYSPKLLRFGQMAADSVEKVMKIDMLTYSGGDLFFETEDLAGVDLGYHTTLSITDLTVKGTSKIISANNVYITLTGANSGITVVDGLPCTGGAFCENGLQTKPPEISIPSNPPIQTVPLDLPLPIMQRNEPTTSHSGILGRYGLQPLFEILIPAYQTIGNYTGIMTYTVIEH